MCGSTVNERSILLLKRRALRRSKTVVRDPESQECIIAPKFKQFLQRLKAPFTKIFWEDMFKENGNEKLVDSGLLSYSYLEAGIIETISG